MVDLLMVHGVHPGFLLFRYGGGLVYHCPVFRRCAPFLVVGKAVHFLLPGLGPSFYRVTGSIPPSFMFGAAVGPESPFFMEGPRCYFGAASRTVLNPLENLLKASKENGTELKIKTAYVSYDEQEERFQSELQKMLQSSKYTTVRAEAEVLKTTPHGGQSESQTGLLVEFDFSNSGSKAFFERNCVEYGFVQRYTENKTSVTRMNPSDSLYRYVGIENAKRMRSYGMCLEEYKSYLQKQAIPK